MLFHELKSKALGQLASLRASAERIRERFDAGTPPDELLHDAKMLNAMYQSLKPLGVSNDVLERHLRFLEYYLERGRPEACRSDIDDICQVDLPNLEKTLLSQNANQQHYDAELFAKLGTLIEEQHLDSAVRKAFVILKERIVEACGVAPELDGAALVNSVFSSKGCFAGKISEPERQAMRDLLAGLFGVFRNRYGHRDIDPSWYEAAAVLGMINWALRWVDENTAAKEGL